MDLPRVEKLMLESVDDDAPPSPKTMEDLSPEVLTKILKFVMLNGNKTDVLGYRVVNSQWMDIMNSLIGTKIALGEFPVCPEMNIMDVDSRLYVRKPSTIFPVDRNPFPFNSLHFNGSSRRRLPNNENESSYVPLLPLSAFASRFGGNLTTFSIYHQEISINTMAALLGSMPNLKRLSLQATFLVHNPNGEAALLLPNAPLSPHLKILELKIPGRIFYEFSDLLSHNSLYPLSVWLIVSYANQLERLDMESRYPFPPLQTNHHYMGTLCTGETLPIGTTAHCAFRNLKELITKGANEEFLLLSETPALQSLSVIDNNYDSGLEAVITFIERYHSSLETIVLISFHIMDKGLTEDEARRFLDGHRPLFLQPSQVEFPRLKTVTISYPKGCSTEMLLAEFMDKFQALEKLHLVCFRFHAFDKMNPMEDVEEPRIMFGGVVGNENNQNADKILALKEQLNPLLQRWFVMWNNKYLAEIRKCQMQEMQEGELDQDELRQLKEEIERLENDMATARTERIAIFHRLTDLGENAKKVMVEEMLERVGLWNICPRLKVVSVSTLYEPTGDICVVERADEALA